MPLHSEWYFQSNHGLRFYLYCLCMIFDLARVIASSQGRRRIFKNLKRGRRSLARRRGNQDVTLVYNSLAPISKQLRTLAQLVKAWDFKVWRQGLQFESWQDHCIFLLQNFSYFSIFILFNIFMHFIFISIIFIMHFKIPKNIFLFALFSENLYLIYKIKKYYFACIFIFIFILSFKSLLIAF